MRWQKLFLLAPVLQIWVKFLIWLHVSYTLMVTGR